MNMMLRHESLEDVHTYTHRYIYKHYKKYYTFK